jgi:hypothetical protein
MPSAPVPIYSHDMDFAAAQKFAEIHLTPEERAAVKLYKSDITSGAKDYNPPGYFEQLNAALRAGTTSLPYQAHTVQHLDEASRRFIFAETVLLYRGIGVSATKLAGVTQVGQRWAEKAYSSCTTEEYRAWEFARRSTPPGGAAVLLELEVAAGVNVLPIVGQTNDLESEWLLPRGCGFWMCVTQESNGAWRLRMRVDPSAGGA